MRVKLAIGVTFFRSFLNAFMNGCHDSRLKV
jgi:hypothetical protein